MSDLLSLWEAALSQPYGLRVVVDVTERKLLQQQLYRARVEAADERFKDLVITVPEGDGELWIVHRDADERARDDEQ